MGSRMGGRMDGGGACWWLETSWDAPTSTTPVVQRLLSGSQLANPEDPKSQSQSSKNSPASFLDILRISIKKCSCHHKHYKRHLQNYTSDQELHLSFGTMLSLIIHLLLGDYHRWSNYNWRIPDFVKIDWWCFPNFLTLIQVWQWRRHQGAECGGWWEAGRLLLTSFPGRCDLHSGCLLSLTDEVKACKS